MTIVLSTQPMEGGTAKFTVAFKDEDNAAVTPNWAEWSLTDEHGIVINRLSGRPIVEAASVVIVLTGNDLEILSEYDTGKRLLLVIGQYDSNIGSDLPFRKIAEFTIEKSPAIISGDIIILMDRLASTGGAKGLTVA